MTRAAAAHPHAEQLRAQDGRDHSHSSRSSLMARAHDAHEGVLQRFAAGAQLARAPRR